MNCDTKLPLCKKKAPTWNYFKRLSPAVAKCNTCKKKLSFKTTISNLKRHLLLKHNVNLLHKAPKEFTFLDEEDNVKKFLNLVEQHKCLWRYEATENTKYTNPDQKYEAWKQIASILCPEVDVIVAVPKLSERFHALKTHFFEDKTGRKKVPPAYQESLQFLNSAHEALTDLSKSSLNEDMEQEQMQIFEINEVNVKNEPIDESYEVNERPIALPSNQVESSLSTRNAVAEESSPWTEKDRCSATHQRPNADSNPKEERKPTQYSLQLNNADKDVLFLLSLTEDMKRVPKESKTKFKVELIVTISRLLKKYNQSSRGG